MRWDRDRSAPMLLHESRHTYNPAANRLDVLMALSKQQVIDALRTVKDPELFKDIVTLNMVKDVQVNGEAVELTVELTTPACPLKEVIEKDVRAALSRIGVTE